MSNDRTLKAVYIGRAGDFETTAERIAHVEHLVERSAPIPAYMASELLKMLKDAISERDAYRQMPRELHDDLAGLISGGKD